MKTRLIVFASLLFVILFLSSYHILSHSSGQKKNISAFINDFHDGDIIFQTTESESSKAIALATHSPYTHCGLIFSEGKSFFVLEAIQPVSVTPLNEFIDRGKLNHYVVKRLKGSDSLLSKNSLKNLKSEGKKLIGKDYDIYFGWDDEKIYCSELVWKVYNRSTGLEVGKPEKLRNFDLTNKLVKKQLQQRYGNNIPLNETVISPADIFNSNLLETIFEN